VNEHLPTFGPTGLQNVHDDAPEPFAVVRLDYRVSRREMLAALVLGFTEMIPDRDPDTLTVEEVRREVEGTLAFASANDVWRMLERIEDGRLSAEQRERLAGLERAMDRAYAVQVPVPAVQGPRFGDDRIIIRTLDKGEVTIGEPDWCLGHEGEPVGYFADVTHHGPPVVLEFDGEQLLAARISWGPFAELRPEPYPVVDVEELHSLDPEQLRELAAKVASYAGDLYRLAVDAERLRGYEQ
jgi:hypothetical protein